MGKSIYIYMFLLISSCQSQEKSNKITINSSENKIMEVLFYEQSHGLINPNSIKKRWKISMNNNYIYKYIEEYKDTALINIDTITIIDNNSDYKKILANISDKYFSRNQIFGSPNVVDEGSLGVTFRLKNNKNIFWELSYRKDEHPKKIQLIYKMYEEIQQKFKENLKLETGN